jgi:bacterioferritin (cytochrome b1)
MKTVETLLNDQLAACLMAMQDCLAHSRKDNDDDDYGHLRREDVAHMAKLMKASARLTEALAKLKGESRMNIHVTRDGDKGSG